MDYKPGRRTSIDGIYASGPTKKPRQPVNKAISLDYLTKTKQPMPMKKISPPPVERAVKPVLNVSIPNPRYSFEPEPDVTKKVHFRRWRNMSTKRRFVTSALMILLIGFGFGAWYGTKILGSVDKVFHGNVFSDASALFSDAKLNGESSGRVNILVAGDSSDDPGHAGADLTDSIMVLSIDTKNNTGFMLSIPRDLWVNIPGQGNQKINAANDVTNFSAPGYPSGGMGQLQEIVQTDLGIPINYYALVNYQAFEDGVNAVGGITVDIQSSDPRGLYDAYTNLKLPNGEDALNGQEALNLARARGDGSAGDISYGFPNTDFDRTEHQREMGIAIAKKATSIGVVTNPVKVTDLFSALAKNVQTNLSLQNGLRLAQIIKGLNLNNLGSYTYSSSTTGATSPLLVGYTDPDSGQESLAPAAGVGDFDQLQNYYLQITSDNPIVKENPSVAILNGSDVVGLAKKEEGILQNKGVTNITIADANNEYPGTMIVDNSKGADPETKQLLEQLYPGTTVTTDTGSTEAEEAQGYSANFVIILGQNWDSTSTTTASDQ